LHQCTTAGGTIEAGSQCSHQEVGHSCPNELVSTLSLRFPF
jgi:hypothetical protein